MTAAPSIETIETATPVKTASDIGLCVNGERLMATLTELGAIGGTENGGVTRLAFSPEDAQARDRLSHWMQAAGMTVRIDTAGNLIGRYGGRYSQGAAIATRCLRQAFMTVPTG